MTEVGAGVGVGDGDGIWEGTGVNDGTMEGPGKGTPRARCANSGYMDGYIGGMGVGVEVVNGV